MVVSLQIVFNLENVLDDFSAGLFNIDRWNQDFYRDHVMVRQARKDTIIVEKEWNICEH